MHWLIDRENNWLICWLIDWSFSLGLFAWFHPVCPQTCASVVDCCFSREQTGNGIWILPPSCDEFILSTQVFSTSLKTNYSILPQALNNFILYANTRHSLTSFSYKWVTQCYRQRFFVASYAPTRPPALPPSSPLVPAFTVPVHTTFQFCLIYFSRRSFYGCGENTAK